MRFLALPLLAAVIAAGPVAWAGALDHERARDALESGQIMPLHEILKSVEQAFNGRVIEVRLVDLAEGLHGWVYDVTLLSPQDNVLRIKVDAGTAVLLRVEGHGIEEARKAQ